MYATEPKVIFRNSERRIVAKLNEVGNAQVFFEKSEGVDAMGIEAWVSCWDDKALVEFAKDLAISLAKEQCK